MKFPYGISDFKKIITQKYFFCDRTNMIPLIENAGESILFLRPRRFGKSLVLSMLENYYDIAKKDQFQALFAHLHIGKNPTPLHNQFAASYLYYVGALTLVGETKTGDTALKIPNLIMKSLYIDRIIEMLLPNPSIRDAGKSAAKQIYKQGNMQPICDFVVNHYFKILSNRDYAWANELTVKIAFLTLLYNSNLFIMDSEAEIDRRYTDLTMIIRPDKRHFEIFDVLIEFKYISLKESGLTGEIARNMDQKEVDNLPCVIENMNAAIHQANQYADALKQIYTALNLKSFAVVALGFDRISWKAIEDSPLF